MTLPPRVPSRNLAELGHQPVGRRLGSVATRYQLPLAYRPAKQKPPQRTLGQNDISCQTSLLEDPLCRVEAILFLAKEPLPSRKLSRYANLADGTEARTLVNQLNQRYEKRGSAFHVEQVGGGYQLLTRSEFAPWLRRLRHVPGEIRLSSPALEALAVVAYRQPIPRAEVEAIRGVSCGEILRQLLEQDLIRIGGRGKDLGRPYLYVTTRKFLQLFGMRSLEQLPRADQWRRHASHGATHDNKVRTGNDQMAPADSGKLQVEEEADVTLSNIIETTIIHPLASTPRSARGDLLGAKRREIEELVGKRDEDEDFEEDDEYEEEEFEEEDEEEDELEDEELEEDEEFEDEEDDEEEEWNEVDADEDEEEDEDWDDDDWDDDEEDEEEEEEEEDWE